VRLRDREGRREADRRAACRSGNCASALFTCVQTKPGDGACLGKADACYGKKLIKLDCKVAKIAATLDKVCAAVDFATLRATDAVFFAALSQPCVAVGVTTLESFANYRECAKRRHVCETEDLTRST
jgi:hypothetical protein